MQFAETFLKWLRSGELVICSVAFSIMAIALISDVLARELSGTGLFGASQIGVFGMVIVAYLGIGLATADGTHLRPRFADRLIPEKWETQFNRVADVITATFYWFVAIVAVSVVEESYELGDVTSTLRWFIWPFQMVIVLAFFIGGVRHILFAIFPPLRPAETQSKETSANSSKDGGEGSA